jgi:hypothetical protein
MQNVAVVSCLFITARFSAAAGGVTSLELVCTPASGAPDGFGSFGRRSGL